MLLIRALGQESLRARCWLVLPRWNMINSIWWRLTKSSHLSSDKDKGTRFHQWTWTSDLQKPTDMRFISSVFVVITRLHLQHLIICTALSSPLPNVILTTTWLGYWDRYYLHFQRRKLRLRDLRDLPDSGVELGFTLTFLCLQSLYYWYCRCTSAPYPRPFNNARLGVG